ncbi:hypothetical protein OCK74_18805 [Chitinophagaceae bacterium LB-8]|uniref:Lipoprotein n=1 Tax=Paraflavisolibacter caeni TaxID=2982496 RepID=A0A9X2Y104_9BACT|nr:hypothetical protein [Paraflavisolibacter caeni]MCU7551178.1 hypothetical protein [Paraflavisolibacter caeni]
MQLKLFVCLFVLIILAACSTTKVIKLSAANGASKELGYGYGHVKTTNADSSYATYARKLGLDSFVLVRFNHYPYKACLKN